MRGVRGGSVEVRLKSQIGRQIREIENRETRDWKDTRVHVSEVCKNENEKVARPKVFETICVVAQVLVDDS